MLQHPPGGMVDMPLVFLMGSFLSGAALSIYVRVRWKGAPVLLLTTGLVVLLGLCAAPGAGSADAVVAPWRLWLVAACCGPFWLGTLMGTVAANEVHRGAGPV